MIRKNWYFEASTWAVVIGCFILLGCGQPRDAEWAKGPFVASVRIDQVRRHQVRGVECGTQYEGEVLEANSVARQGDHIRFGRNAGLMRGKTIRGAFVWVESAEHYRVTLPEGLLAEYERDGAAARELLICDGLVPGLFLIPCADKEGEKECQSRGDRMYQAMYQAAKK
ncbi:MAG: hypothetical protein HYZ17_14700 [Betaproteobacteria bacterium]|nr:hypothetical protein [Betaproteobacteria bacterium]